MPSSEKRRQQRLRSRQVRPGGFVLAIAEEPPDVFWDTGQFYFNSNDDKHYVTIGGVWVACSDKNEAKKKIEKFLKIKKGRR